jgi:biopolymer transport protein ExbD
MLDMVFQLITFFMLVINFKSASYDLSLKLPVIGSAMPVDNEGMDDYITLNINSQGQLMIYGLPKDLKSYIAGEAEVSRLAKRVKNPAFKKGDKLDTQVVIRADRNIRFHLLHNVIEICQKQGFLNFSLKAMNKEE